MNNQQIAYLFVRLSMAVSMFTHGFVRLPKMDSFSAGMVESFADSMLPVFLVRPWSYAVPVIEFILGILLFLGWFTRLSGIVGAVFMLILLFGSGMNENWGAFPSQLLHIAFFGGIVLYVQYNKWALDNVLKR